MSFPPLPDWRASTEVWENPEDYEPKPRFGGRPEVSSLHGHVVIDWWSLESLNGKLSPAMDKWIDGAGPFPGPFAVKVWKRRDHPNIGLLPKNAPRAVRAIYRAEVQLKHLRATHYFVVANDMNLAELAWKKYQEALSRHAQ